MPEFDTPNAAELRAMWRTYTNPEVRCLIRKIVMLRNSHNEIKTWFDRVDQEVVDKGPFAGPQGHFSATAPSPPTGDAARGDSDDVRR